MDIGRRTFLAGAAVTVSGMTAATAQNAVPNSDGTEAPKLKAPANACDCHMHIYDGDRFPPARPGPQSRMQANAAAAQYQLLQQRNGTTRTVIVTPAAYVTDNRVTLDGIEQLGRDKTRGVAVVHPTNERSKAVCRRAGLAPAGKRVAYTLELDFFAADRDSWLNLPDRSP